MNENSSSVHPLEIKWMSPNEETGVLAFYKNNLNEYERFLQYWEWRKESLPFSMTEKALIAVYENTGISGCIGIVPVDMYLSDKTVNACWQQDSLVSFSARGQGLGKKLVVKAHEGYELTLAKGTSTAMYGLRKYLGYEDVPFSNHMIRVCRSKDIQGSIIKKGLFYFLGMLSGVFPLPKTEQSINVERINEFDESFDDLATAMADDHTLRHRKGKDYLNWRYSRCPGKTYTILKAGTEKARGAIIVNCVGPDSDEGWIVDMICNSVDRACAYALIHAALCYFKKKQVTRIWCFATHPIARRWFYRFGFLPTNRSPRFTYLASPDLKIKISRYLWDFWHGDGDIELYQ